MSVPNQKVVYIHKRKYTGNFLQIGIDEMRLAQQQMTYCEFVLYLYLAGNANGFKLELSQQAFENTTGYKKTAYHNAVNKLIELGYLTQSYNYHYEFHTTPVRSSKLNFEVLSNGKSMPPEKTKKAFNGKTSWMLSIVSSAVWKNDLRLQPKRRNAPLPYTKPGMLLSVGY